MVMNILINVNFDEFMELILKAARKIYADYPEIIEALGL